MGAQTDQKTAAPTDRAGSPILMARLTRRSEFLAAAKGAKHAGRTCVVQARPREAGEPEARAGIRVGFTATRKIGGAVTRNRAKRRLREAARLLLPRLGRPGVDYVFVARQDTATAPWASLLDDVESALIRLAPSVVRASRPRNTPGSTAPPPPES